MTMPKAAMHKHHGPVFGQNNIWFPRQILGVQPKPQTCRMQCFSDNYFRHGILALDASHHAAAGRLVNNVNQRLF